jgi:hypothetical protein
MPKRVYQFAALMVAIAAAGCAQYPGTPSPTGLLGHSTGDAAGRPMALSSMPGLTVSGLVLAPAGVISAGGANVISAGGANVVSAGGSNVISAGGANLVGARAVLGLSDETPVSGASVYLADMAGRPLPGTAQAVSDGQGRYAFHQVPANVAYMVVATFRTPKGDATLRSLGVSGQGGGDQVVSVASTLVTLAVTQAGATHIAPEAFQAATEAVAADLRDDALPDLTRPAEVAARAQAIASTVAPVRQAILDKAHAPAIAPPKSKAPSVAVPAAPTTSSGPSGSYVPVDAGVPAAAEDTSTGTPAATEPPASGGDTSLPANEPPSTEPPATGDGQNQEGPDTPDQPAGDPSGTTDTQPAPSTPAGTPPADESSDPVNEAPPPGYDHQTWLDLYKKWKDKWKDHWNDHVPPGQAKKTK